MELGIKDQMQIKVIYPDAERALSLAQKAINLNLSVFGMPPIKKARERLGTHLGDLGPSATACLGHLDEVQAIKEDTRYLRIRGWIFNRAVVFATRFPESCRWPGPRRGYCPDRTAKA